MVRLKNDSDRLIHETENTMKEFKEKLSEEILNKVKDDISGLNMAIVSDDTGKIQKAYD